MFTKLLQISPSSEENYEFFTANVHKFVSLWQERNYDVLMEIHEADLLPSLIPYGVRFKKDETTVYLDEELANYCKNGGGEWCVSSPCSPLDTVKPPNPNVQNGQNEQYYSDSEFSPENKPDDIGKSVSNNSDNGVDDGVEFVDTSAENCVVIEICDMPMGDNDESFFIVLTMDSEMEFKYYFPTQTIERASTLGLPSISAKMRVKRWIREKLIANQKNFEQLKQQNPNVTNEEVNEIIEIINDRSSTQTFDQNTNFVEFNDIKSFEPYFIEKLGADAAVQFPWIKQSNIQVIIKKMEDVIPSIE